MAQLNKAPLLEVILELTWQSVELEKFQLKAGALCSRLENDYATPTNLLPDPNMPISAAIGKPVYRCVCNKDPKLMFQIGPGLLSVNYVGQTYEWDSFLSEVKTIVESFMATFKFEHNNQLGLNLKYVDFFPYNFAQQGHVLDFVREKFHIDVNAEFLDDIKELGLRTGHITDAGIFRFVLNTAQLLKSKEIGFIVESQINNIVPVNDNTEFSSKICRAHEYLSGFFKMMTGGELYESFK